MRRFLLLWGALLLAACAADGVNLRPGSASEEDVLRTMGQPAVKIPNPDGSRQLAYPSGYYGTRTMMVRLGRDGKVESVEQVLNEDHFYRIQQGQTRDDVMRLIGPPRETFEFARLQQVAWDYRYQDAWGYIAVLSVMFNREWQVVGKVTRRLERENRAR